MRNIAAEPRYQTALPIVLACRAFPPEGRAPPSSPTGSRSVSPGWCDRWHREIQSRYDHSSRGSTACWRSSSTLLASFLPALLGPHRDQVEPLWIRTSELFGAVAARRGLAAGEVIEEFQILREAVIRLLYQDPPLGGRVRLSLREVLRLNRALDTGVTHASVGHTDALFFSLFEGSGIPDAPPTAELMAEVRAQLDGVRAELREILGRVPGELAAEGAESVAEV